MEFEVPKHGKRQRCIACGCSVGTKACSSVKKAFSVGMEKAVNFWAQNNIITHYNDHKLCSTCFSMEDISIETKKSSDSEVLCSFLEVVKDYIKKKKIVHEKEEEKVDTEEKKPLLGIKAISEEDCVQCCGLEPNNLEELAEISGCSIQIVFEFFCKCRHSISNRFGGVLFGKLGSGVSHNFGRVLEKLTEDFVPKWLGSSAFSRDQIIKDNTPSLFQEILPDVRGVIDGTYFYIEKSTLFNVQRKTYSGHKKRNLVKEMAIVLPNGKFFDLIGPFFGDGDHNDEWMWRYIVENNCGDVTTAFHKEKDHFLADRGFLHIKEEDGIFSLQCPVGLSPNKKQLSTEEANSSRLVTRFRNVVERAFGRLKERWKIIGGIIDNGLWQKLHDLIRLLAAIDNAYLDPLWIDKESDKVDVESIIQKLHSENELQTLFESKAKNQWKPQTVEEVWIACPQLTLQEIRNWSIGPYALTLAKPYLQRDIQLKFYKHKTEHFVYKVKGLMSRFVSSDSTQPKKYTVVIYIPPTGGEDVLAYCTCKSGARTLGGCAHSCAILYYLTVDQSNEKSSVAQKRVSESGIIDLREFKQKKKNSEVVSDSEIYDMNDSME